MELVKDIAAVIGCILSFITLVTLCSKGLRARIGKLFQSQTEDLHQSDKKQDEAIEEIKVMVESLSKRFSNTEEVLRQQCRNTIKNIYYKYCDAKKIPLYERKTVDKTYQIYHDQMGGNSYAALLYSEICKWEIIALPQDEGLDDFDETLSK